MIWIDLDKQSPSDGQYVVVKKGDEYVVAIGYEKKWFFLDEPSDERFWRPLNVTMKAVGCEKDGSIVFEPIDCEVV